jgi:hypothetical protein
MAAGMHQTRMATGMGQASRFLNGQGVHVSPQAQLASASAAFELTHNTRATQAACDFIAPLLQALCHQIAGAKLLESDLGVLVNVTTQRGEGTRARLQG